MDYKDFSQTDKEKCEFFSYMYIWQFGIDEEVFFGRTWNEFRQFLDILEEINPNRKIVFIHNLSFEFQFLRGHFNFYDVMARNVRHVMKANLSDYNIEFRCSLMMTNCALGLLPEIYNLSVKKLTGDLDYSLIRNSKTTLSFKELKYCMNDILVLYHYVKTELEIYKTVDKIPITLTGHVRRELRELTQKNWNYRNQVKKAINGDPHIYNLLLQAFMGRLYSFKLGLYR